MGKELEAAVRRILPKELADSICPKGFRLAHLYGLPKTHKPRLGMRPMLSATGLTYNYKLAKCLDEKLKSLSINEYTVSHPLNFAEELREKQMVKGHILVSYDVHHYSQMYQLTTRSKFLPKAHKAFEKEWLQLQIQTKS